MRIVIPMAGKGERFLKHGYKDPKHLIKVGKDYMIKQALDKFPGEQDIVFIVNRTHLRKTQIKNVLTELSPKAKIIPINYRKRGPVWAVIRALSLDPNYIPDEKPILVSYCDFGVEWDYGKFIETLRNSKCDGCVVSYLGFHPHLLDREKRYAGMTVNNKNWVTAIKEKYSFTENLMDSHQSAGSYYFRQGILLKKYAKMLLRLGKSVNGEYYVSQLYELMIKDGLRVLAYPVSYFLQWGTPEDLEHYKYWHNVFGSKNYFDLLSRLLGTQKIRRY